MEQFRGVNLGGWLVLERWMTPELFEGTEATDEYSLSKHHPELAKERIAAHRKSFITEPTIRKVKEFGLNTVRIPVGYWLFGGIEPLMGGADKYLEQAMNWCEKYGIGVIIDFHAAPGSQNGWDHSGQSGAINWGHGETLGKSYDFLELLLDRFGGKTALVGLEVLNEPHWDVPMDTLLTYYDQAYRIIRARDAELPIIMSDAFRPEKMAKQLQKRRYTGVILDVHLYQLYTEEDRALDLHGHLQKVNSEWRELLQKLSKRMPVMVGEWSAAMHEMYLPIRQPEHVNGYDREDYISYFQAQRNLFDELHIGWSYWTAKTTRGGTWSLLDHPEYLGEA